MVPQSPNADTHPASINGMPQIIAHRGYKAAFPENTMAAFRGAVEAGAHAIETDLHLSKDGVVVLVHVTTPLLPLFTHNIDIYLRTPP